MRGKSSPASHESTALSARSQSQGERAELQRRAVRLAIPLKRTTGRGGNRGRSVTHIPPAPSVQTRCVYRRSDNNAKPAPALSPAPQRGSVTKQPCRLEHWTFPRQLFPPARMSKRRDCPNRRIRASEPDYGGDRGVRLASPPRSASPVQLRWDVVAPSPHSPAAGRPNAPSARHRRGARRRNDVRQTRSAPKSNGAAQPTAPLLAHRPCFPPHKTHG